WLFPDPAQNAANEEPSEPREIDYGVKFDEDSPLAPDAFRSHQADGAQSAATSETSPPAIAQASPQRRDHNGNPLAEPAAKVGDYVIDIDPELLANVSDDWVGIRRREARAFYTVIAKARDIPLAILEDA